LKVRIGIIGADRTIKMGDRGRVGRVTPHEYSGSRSDGAKCQRRTPRLILRLRTCGSVLGRLRSCESLPHSTRVESCRSRRSSATRAAKSVNPSLSMLVVQCRRVEGRVRTRDPVPRRRGSCCCSCRVAPRAEDRMLLLPAPPNKLSAAPASSAT
jgi:hypothetical protein